MGRIPLAAALLISACGGDGSPARADGGEPGPPDSGSGGPLAIQTYAGFELAPVALVAVQDGDGPWQQRISNDGHYSAEISTGRYSALIACGAETPPVMLNLLQATLREKSSWAHQCSFEFGQANARVEVT